MGRLSSALSSIKGPEATAIQQILDHRPFNTVEEFLFNRHCLPKLNKKSIDALVRSQALNTLKDDRFTGLKHFWMAVAKDRPRKPKNLETNIEMYAEAGDYTEEEKLQYLVDNWLLSLNLVVDEHVQRRLDELMVPPISEFDPELQLAWFIPREVVRKKTKNGKDFYIVRLVTLIQNRPLLSVGVLSLIR